MLCVCARVVCVCVFDKVPCERVVFDDVVCVKVLRVKELRVCGRIVCV